MILPELVIVSKEPVAWFKTPKLKAAIEPELVSVVVVLVPVEITPAPEALSVMAPELVRVIELPLP